MAQSVRTVFQLLTQGVRLGQPSLAEPLPAIARSVADVPQVYSVPSPVHRVFPIDRVTNPESQNKTECIRITYIEDPFAVNS